MAVERNQLVQAFFDQTHLYLKNRYGIRMRQHVIHELLGKVAGANLIDVGCGDGAISIPLLQNPDNQVTLLDLSDKMLAEAKRHIPDSWQGRVTFVHGDIAAFEPMQQFDVVLCLGVLAHVPSVAETLHKIAAILKPGGQCVVQFTDYDKWIARLDALYFSFRERLTSGHRYHPNRLRAVDVRRKLAEAGFLLKGQRRYSLFLPGMGKLPDSFLFHYQMATLQTPFLSARGSEVVWLAQKQS
ncbi:MAG: class I SAM-dependent methyltransferase [Anaerolineae bacterium]|nr:class I SAM-dependent methyltransferase [Anaerolineae bacterium]